MQKLLFILLTVLLAANCALAKDSKFWLCTKNGETQTEKRVRLTSGIIATGAIMGAIIFPNNRIEGTLVGANLGAGMGFIMNSVADAIPMATIGLLPRSLQEKFNPDGGSFNYMPSIVNAAYSIGAMCAIEIIHETYLLATQ